VTEQHDVIAVRAGWAIGQQVTNGRHVTKNDSAIDEQKNAQAGCHCKTPRANAMSIVSARRTIELASAQRVHRKTVDKYFRWST